MRKSEKAKATSRVPGSTVRGVKMPLPEWWNTRGGMFWAPKRRRKEDNKLSMKCMLSSRVGPSKGVRSLPFLEPCLITTVCFSGKGKQCLPFLSFSRFSARFQPLYEGPQLLHYCGRTVTQVVRSGNLPSERCLTNGVSPVHFCGQRLQDARLSLPTMLTEWLSCRFLCFFRFWRLGPEF